MPRSGAARRNASVGWTTVSELESQRFCPLLRGGLGEPYLHSEETSSTQDLLRDGALPHGAVAVAEHQTAGRGRSGRCWDDTPSTALLCSVLLRPPATVALQQLSLVVGLAASAAIEQEAGVPALLRWPNDVLVENRKVAGILLEASEGAVICGIGINVNQTEGELPRRPRTPATSLRIAAGRAFDRGTVLASMLIELEWRYSAWLADGLACLADELEHRNAVHGLRVRVGGRTGTGGPIATDGRLTIVLDRGVTVLIGTGEVEIRDDV
jgi:BirA family biotin operon repressor/biotin-[acetyl-CoA-carboxylase] ligase